MNMLDSVEADFLAEFDLEDMRAIEDGDLSLFSSLSDATAYRLQTDLNMMHSNNSNYKNMNDMKLNVVVEEDEDPQDPHHSNTNSSPPNSTNSGGAEFNETPQNSAQTQEPDNSKPPAQPLQSPDDAPAPPPLVVCPIEVGKTSITLQKNQLCACKECGKLFKSIWYLKQHAVRHSNERPFKCNYCQKAFKFRSNLYQHNCPERVRQRGPNAPIRGMPGGPPNGTATPSSNKKRFYTRGVGYTEMYAQPALDQNMMNNNMMDMQMAQQQMMYDMNFADGQMPMGMGDFGYQMNGFDVKQEPVDQLQTGTIGTNGSIGTNGALNGQNGVLGQNGALNGQNLPIGPNGTLGAQNGALCLSGQNGALGGPNGALAGQMGSNGAMNSEIQGFEEHGNFVHDVNSVHTKPLDPEYIDQYLEKNKHRIYTCKKCKLNFPHREYLQRHMAYHNDLDNRPYGCGQCPQRFHSPKQLESHQQKHAEDSPHRCQQCAGAFRSALALRRHKDQSRQCYCPPFGVYPQLLSSPTAPLDQYAFIDSDNEADDDSVKGLQLNRQKSTTDSGMGSDSSTHSFTTSPVSTRNNNLDEELDPSHQNSTNQFAQPTQYMMNPPDTIKEDPDGFRSRLNSSTTQSCSPGSSFSGESAGSPSQRKYSNSMGNNGSSMGPHSMGSNGQTQGDYGYHMGYQYPAQYQHGQYQNGATYSPTTYGTNSTYGAQGQDKSRAGFSGLKNAGYTIKNGSFASKKTDFWRKTKDFGTKNDKDTAKTSKKDGNHSSYYLVESTTSIEATARIAMLSGDDLFNDEDQPTPQAVLFDQIQSKLLAGKATSNMTSQVDMTGNDEEYPGEDLCIDFGGVDVEDEVEKEINRCIRILLTLFLSTAATISRAKTE